MTQDIKLSIFLLNDNFGVLSYAKFFSLFILGVTILEFASKIYPVYLYANAKLLSTRLTKQK